MKPTAIAQVDLATVTGGAAIPTQAEVIPGVMRPLEPVCPVPGMYQFQQLRSRYRSYSPH